MKGLSVNQEYYKGPNPDSWKGRSTDIGIAPQYWYQNIQLGNLSDVSDRPKDEITRDIAVLGYDCDEGVVRNEGRAGAADGPHAIRCQLAKLAYHHDKKVIMDVGDIICADQHLENCQKELSTAVCHLLKCNTVPIVMGGGHDMAYGHFNGIKNAFSGIPQCKIGIVNFDAHFDLRKVHKMSNSGTPFYQILTENEDLASYFVLGIQRQSNTQELFSIAQEFDVGYLNSDQCTIANLSKAIQELSKFVESVDRLYVTIDLDAISSAYAPGVSAPSPVGIEPSFLFAILPLLIDPGKVVSFDIAELNPLFDRDNMTANLAARLVDHIILCL